MKVNPLTREQLLALPPATDLRSLAKAFGISEPVARERHQRGEFAEMGIRILRLGAQWRVVTADVWRALGVASEEISADGNETTTAAGNLSHDKSTDLRQGEWQRGKAAS